MYPGVVEIRQQLDKYKGTVYGDDGELLCEYRKINDTVVDIEFGENNKLPITVYSEEDLEIAINKAFECNWDNLKIKEKSIERFSPKKYFLLIENDIFDDDKWRKHLNLQKAICEDICDGLELAQYSSDSIYIANDLVVELFNNFETMFPGYFKEERYDHKFVQ